MESDVSERGGAPLFFVSVASKRLRDCVSLVFATLRGGCVSVASKGLTGAYWRRESNWIGTDGFEGVRRTAWRAPMIGEHARFVPKFRKHYSISVQFVKWLLVSRFVAAG
jgi:hypothetical protein